MLPIAIIIIRNNILDYLPAFWYEYIIITMITFMIDDFMLP